MATAVILSNGTPPPRDVLARAVRSAGLFVCADGGANTAREHGLTPAAIVGDLDSVRPETLVHFKHVPVHRDPDTERTDTEKALDYALERGPFAEITIFGASQGRLDHVLGHVSLLRKYGSRARIVLEDAHGRAYLARKDLRLDLAPGTILSFFAAGGRAEGVTTENLRYALHDRTLELGAQDSISNVVERSPARIRIARGELVIIEVTNP